jgi:hypothetical protein
MQEVIYNRLFLKKILSEAFARLMTHRLPAGWRAGQFDGELHRLDQTA